MKNNLKIHARLGEQLEELRRIARISVKQLCADAQVSTRTYAKIKKRKTVKSECYVRLLCGICKGATYEEFMESCRTFGDWFYGEFSEE